MSSKFKCKGCGEMIPIELSGGFTKNLKDSSSVPIYCRICKPFKRIPFSMKWRVWDDLEKKRIEEGYNTASKFISHIIEDYLKFGSKKHNLSEVHLAKYEDLLQKQQKYLDQLDVVMRNSAQNDPRPNDYEQKSHRIIEFLKRIGAARFEEIANITGIDEFEVFIILSHLYDQNKILYNTKREYYIV